MPSITETFSKAYAAWRHGGSWGDAWKKFAKPGQAVPEAPELPGGEAPETPVPEAKVSAVNVAELQASVVNLRAELADVRGQLANKTQSLERLERSLGLAAANVVPYIPTSSEYQSPIDIFNSMPEGRDKSRFYQEHEATIRPFINQPVQS